MSSYLGHNESVLEPQGPRQPKDLMEEILSVAIDPDGRDSGGRRTVPLFPHQSTGSCEQSYYRTVHPGATYTTSAEGTYSPYGAGLGNPTIYRREPTRALDSHRIRQEIAAQPIEPIGKRTRGWTQTVVLLASIGLAMLALGLGAWWTHEYIIDKYGRYFKG